LWKRKHFEEGSEPGNISLFEEPEAEAFFIKLEAGMWKRKRLNFCGNGSTLKKEAETEANYIYRILTCSLATAEEISLTSISLFHTLPL